MSLVNPNSNSKQIFYNSTRQITADSRIRPLIIHRTPVESSNGNSHQQPSNMRISDHQQHSVNKHVLSSIGHNRGWKLATGS